MNPPPPELALLPLLSLDVEAAQAAATASTAAVWELGHRLGEA